MCTVKRVVCLVWKGFSFKAGKIYDVRDNGKFLDVKAPRGWQDYNKCPENSKFRPAYANDKEGQ